MKILNYKQYIKEVSSYHNLRGDDEYEITKVERDDLHKYKYVDGILYELDGGDIIVSIDEIEHTDENIFYEDQIERYIEYFRDGGICQTFPVSIYPLGHAYSLGEMIDYLNDTDNFDLFYDLLNGNKLFDMSDELHYNSDDYDIDKSVLTVRNVEQLDEVYNEGEDGYNEEIYSGFVKILEHWEESKSYSLTDFNHRLTALERMGKSQVMVDPS